MGLLRVGILFDSLLEASRSLALQNATCLPFFIKTNSNIYYHLPNSCLPRELNSNIELMHLQKTNILSQFYYLSDHRWLQDKLPHTKYKVIGVSLRRSWDWKKIASLKPHFGHGRLFVRGNVGSDASPTTFCMVSLKILKSLSRDEETIYIAKGMTLFRYTLCSVASSWWSQFLQANRRVLLDLSSLGYNILLLENFKSTKSSRYEGIPFWTESDAHVQQNQ